MKITPRVRRRLRTTVPHPIRTVDAAPIAPNAVRCDHELLARQHCGEIG